MQITTYNIKHSVYICILHTVCMVLCNALLKENFISHHYTTKNIYNIKKSVCKNFRGKKTDKKAVFDSRCFGDIVPTEKMF